jgi:hypothetical protein
MLNTVIDREWEPAIAEQWRTNQAGVRMDLLAELGTLLGKEKIANFTAMGPAPWSVAYEHIQPLQQVRSAFAHGDFYPALVGACALGERIFNQLLLELRADYVNHRATTRTVRNSDNETFTNWDMAIDVLHGWGVLDDGSATTYRELAEQRHATIHYDAAVPAASREPALAAVMAVQSIVGVIFAPLGGPPRFIAGTEGASFIALDAEQQPLIARIVIPRSVLLSPAHRMYPDSSNVNTWTVVDDRDYDPTPLTDEEFAAALPASIAAMHPEFTTNDNAQTPDSESNGDSDADDLA